MILLEKYNFTLTNPLEINISVDIKNFLYDNLDRGQCVFIIPEDMKSMSKNLKRNYKVGFLFDLLGKIYPGKNNTEKHEIIANKYHFWFTYRQFRNILDEYEKDRSKYLLKRSLLCI